MGRGVAVGARGRLSSLCLSRLGDDLQKEALRCERYSRIGRNSWWFHVAKRADLRSARRASPTPSTAPCAPGNSKEYLLKRKQLGPDPQIRTQSVNHTVRHHMGLVVVRVFFNTERARAVARSTLILAPHRRGRPSVWAIPPRRGPSERGATFYVNGYTAPDHGASHYGHNASDHLRRRLPQILPIASAPARVRPGAVVFPLHGKYRPAGRQPPAHRSLHR